MTTAVDDLKSDITCPHCGSSWEKKLLPKSCGNCFACTGCEAYICPACRGEIMITPPRPMKRKKD